VTIDVYLFNIINGLVGKWPILDFLAIFFAVYFGYILIFLLLLFLIKDYKRYWRMVVESFLAALLVRFTIVELFYLIYFRARPFIHNQVKQLISYDFSQTSLPSGHASFYFALSTIIYGYNKKLGCLFFISSLLISISRVFVGVHWPSDIICGAIIGILMGIVLNKLFIHLNKKITIKKAS